METIYRLNAVNAIAAIVTNQKGCVSEITDEQRRENLVAQQKKLEELLITFPRKSKERGMIAHEKRKIEAAIHKIRPKTKAKGIEMYILDILREEMTQFEFNRIMGRARVKMEEAGGLIVGSRTSVG